MASSRDMNPSARPLTQRPSVSNGSATGLPGRSGHVRNSSHSLLTSSLNPNHRVTRRKSVTGPNANLAAVTAHLQGTGERTAAVPIAGRRNTFSRGGRPQIAGSLPSPPASLPGKSIAETTSAIDDSNDLSADDGTSPKDNKLRMRRASDGQPLTKEGKKGNRDELKCQHCGKGYKHSSCLTKHLWEHTPEWSLTSKLLISKHQQVQLLEAATVLVKMTGERKEGEATPPESTKGSPPSDVESAASPDITAYSEQGDRLSSADTTPPPMAEGMGYRNQRHSSIGNYSRSYQSAPSAGSLPRSSGFGHSRNPSDPRPPSSGVNNTDQTDRDLAACLGALSGSFGSNSMSHGTVMLNDAPPVPQVPAEYRNQQATSFGGSYMNSFPRRQPESFTRGGSGAGEDIQMGNHTDSGADEDDFDVPATRGVRSDEDDDGVFGSMEE